MTRRRVLVGTDGVASRITADGLARSLHPARARLASAGVAVEAAGRFGDPAAEIVAFAEERGADLVALTRPRRGGPRSWLPGTTADHVRREFRGALLVRPAT